MSKRTNGLFITKGKHFLGILARGGASGYKENTQYTGQSHRQMCVYVTEKKERTHKQETEGRERKKKR